MPCMDSGVPALEFPWSTDGCGRAERFPHQPESVAIAGTPAGSCGRGKRQDHEPDDRLTGRLLAGAPDRISRMTATDVGQRDVLIRTTSLRKAFGQTKALRD